MKYNRDMFIFGKPIDTKFGKVRFLTFEEYHTFLPQLSLISMNNLHIYYYNKKAMKNPSQAEMELLKGLKEASLYEIVLKTPQLLATYIEIFNKLITFKKGVDCTYILKSEVDFFEMRKLIMDMNVISEEDVNPNEEIQSGIERSRRAKQAEAKKQSFVTIVTSIVAKTSHSYEEVSQMNVMQVYALYARIGAFLNYETTTLFATVAEKVKIELWDKHIDLFEKESHSIEHDKFKRGTGSIFSE